MAISINRLVDDKLKINLFIIVKLIWIIDINQNYTLQNKAKNRNRQSAQVEPSQAGEYKRGGEMAAIAEQMACQLKV